MFGDLFGQRGDYTTGLIYSCHRSYMNNEQKVEPPTEFKTLRQAKRASTSMNRNSDSTKAEEGGFNLKNSSVFDSLRKDGKILQKAAKNSLDKRIILDKYSTTDKSYWKEDKLAGCRVWINKSSGEVSQECPYKTETPSKPASREFNNNNSVPTERLSFKEGTGALVYDNSELLDLFNMLESL